MTRNQIEYQKSEEQKRTNLANEGLRGQELAETTRSHIATEAETQRANKAREYETNRANVARETETHRANTAAEALGYANLSLGYSTLGETTRSHLAQELENNRHNLSVEAETSTANRNREYETNRTNVANESLKSAAQKLDYALGVRRDETTRRGQDISASVNVTTGVGKSIGGLVGTLMKSLNRR